MKEHVPPRPPKSYRVTLDLARAEKRLDNVLLAAVRELTDNIDLKNISRTEFKALFADGKIQIKGQRAKPSSAVAKGITYVDILK